MECDGFSQCRARVLNSLVTTTRCYRRQGRTNHDDKLSIQVFPSLLLLFFFSSRRRHTRYWRDWSSDVCSSDLTRIRANAVFTSLTSSSMVQSMAIRSLARFLISGSRRDRTACLTLMRSLIAIGIYIRNIVLLGRRNSMCVHMQKPFEPGQAHFITCVAS